MGAKIVIIHSIIVRSRKISIMAKSIKSRTMKKKAVATICPNGAIRLARYWLGSPSRLVTIPDNCPHRAIAVFPIVENEKSHILMLEKKKFVTSFEISTITPTSTPLKFTSKAMTTSSGKVFFTSYDWSRKMVANPINTKMSIKNILTKSRQKVHPAVTIFTTLGAPGVTGILNVVFIIHSKTGPSNPEIVPKITNKIYQQIEEAAVQMPNVKNCIRFLIALPIVSQGHVKPPPAGGVMVGLPAVKSTVEGGAFNGRVLLGPQVVLVIIARWLQQYHVTEPAGGASPNRAPVPPAALHLVTQLLVPSPTATQASAGSVPLQKKFDPLGAQL